MINIKRISVIPMILLLASMLGFGASAASAKTSVSVPSQVTVGDTVELLLTFSAESIIGWVETDVVYNDKILNYEDGAATGGAGVLHLHVLPETETDSFAVSLKFTASAAGEAEIDLKNCVVSAPDGSALETSSAATVITVKPIEGEESSSSEPESVSDSSEAQDSSEDSSEDSSVPHNNEGEPIVSGLKKLSITPGKLLPDFSPLIYDYKVMIGKDVEIVNINAERIGINDEIWFKCSTWFEGEVTLTDAAVHIVEDETRVFITIKDEEENEKVYKLYIEKTDDSSKLPMESSMPETTVSASDPVPAETSADTSSVADSSSKTEKSGVSELRDKLMPSLIIILVTLVVSLIIIIAWLKSKSTRKRRKIKSTGGGKK